jgi:prepilin-type N-terminal cleavage/methylation domain-containing protein
MVKAVPISPALYVLQPRGLTMMELLAVILIISMMLGFSGTVYWRMSKAFKEQGAAAELDVALRQVRNSAITANAPAFVELDVENKRVVPWVYKTVGFWHFEDRSSYGRTSGPYHQGIMRGADLFPDGKIGKCVRLHDGACVDVGSDPDFDLQDGGYLEAYIRPATADFNGDSFIFFKKNSYSFRVGLRGVLMGNAGNKTLKAESYHIVPGRWTKVAFTWDRQSTRILVDDGIVAVGPGSKPPLSDYPLLIGHETASLDGLVDEARVMSASAGNTLQLSKFYEIEHNAAPWNAIYFAADGSLDMRYHAGPVRVTITQEKRARSVNVSMLGQITRMEMEKTEGSSSDVAESSAKPAPAKGLVLYDDNGKPIIPDAEKVKEKAERGLDKPKDAKDAKK